MVISEDTSELVTIADIQDYVPVSDRTIRSWVAMGLLPRPVLIGGGYRGGVVGYYPVDAIKTAALLYLMRFMRLEDRQSVILNVQYNVEDDGTITMTVPAKIAKRRSG